MRLTIGILAGGKSKRFGTDKALLEYKNNSFLNHMIKKFEPYADIILSAPLGKYDTPIFTVEDTYSNKGPMGGVFEILKNSKTDWNFIIPVDMPFIDLEVLDFLVQERESIYEGIFFQINHQFLPLPGLYHKSISKKIEKHLMEDKLKLRSFCKTMNHKIINIYDPPLINKFRNINYSTQYKFLEPIIFTISGRKNNGKTTFISKIVKEFTNRGLSVSVIKHDGHDFNINDSGTDTFYFRESGANEVGIYSQSKFQYISKENNLHAILSHFNSYDILIIEGLKNTPLPKFEIIRDSTSKELITNTRNLMGVISDSTNKYHPIQFKSNQINKFCNYILSNFDMFSKDRFLKILKETW